jgi:hypothetical protein
MKRRITLEQLIELVDGDGAFVSVLIERGVIEDELEDFGVEDVDRVLASRTLVHEFEVNWEGVDIILRLREQLAQARCRLAELEERETSSNGDGDE